MRDDMVHVTKYEFSFEEIQELRVIKRDGSYLTMSYNMLWIVNLYEDSVYLAFFVTKTKIMTSAVCFSLSPEQYRYIAKSFTSKVSLHEDSMVKGDSGGIRVFYNDELYGSYNGFPKFINKP